MPSFRGCLALAFILGLAASVSAQTNAGEISGVVRDATGAVLPGATVAATQPATGVTVERVTGADGRFYLPALRVGTWDLRITLPGFAPQQRTGVVLELGRSLTIDVTLGVAALSEQVVVGATTPLLQTTNAEISDIIENREVVQLPLNGRNLMSLAQLSSAVVTPPGGTRGGALQQAGSLPNVGGQRSGHNIYLLDGVTVTDELFNNLVINPSVDSVQEFKIQKSQYPAEFGGKASALINVATRAGTNTWHGSGFEFARNDAFDAPNYFQPAGQGPPPLTQNQFGGTAGGPLVRSSTFLFASYEGQRMNRSLTRTFSVPSLAVRGGDFSGLAAICDPSTVPSAGVCTPFAGNQIPAGRIDPLAAALLQQVPEPTAAGNVQNLTATEASRRQLDQASLRIDQRIGAANQLFGRFSTFDADETQPYGTSTLQETLVPGFGRSLTTKTRNAVVSDTHVFSSAVVNELRGGWLRVSGGQASVNEGNPFASTVGLQGVTSDPRDAGYPQISTGGLYNTFGDPTVFTTRVDSNVELYDNVTLDRGAHRVKFGGYLFHLWLRPVQPDNARGAFTFTGQFTGNAFADFLLGYPTSATVGVGRGGEDGRTTWIQGYVQDDWRVRRNLTLNLGLRVEHNDHMTDAHNRLSTVDPSVPGGRYVIASDDQGNIDPSAAALLPLIPIASTTSKDAGWGAGLLEPSAIRLAPRTSFALSLADDRAVIRGGYGIFLNQWSYSVQTALARNLPFFYTKQVDVPADVTAPVSTTRDILTTAATGTIAPSIMNFDYNVEYAQTWSGGLQYQLGSSTLADVFYMGTLTLGADNSTVQNVPEPGPGSIQARRPIPQLSRINAIRFDGKSVYHAVTFSLERRLASRFAYNVNYTLSRSKDDASSPGPTESENGMPQNVDDIFDETGEWARSSFDHTHQVIASGTYQTPSLVSHGALVDGVLGDWRANTIVVLQSGAPFTVNLSVDRANIGAGPAQRPDQVSDPNLPGGDRTVDRWFDTSAFALPAAFTFGSAPRNSVIGPGYANVDFSLAKDWRLAGERRLEFRWEIFNLFNRANFDLPNRTFGNANFGRIFSAKSPREMQFGLRLSF
jgi:hypothetical protein